MEAACEASLTTLEGRGSTCIQKIATPSGFRKNGDFYRTRSTVDYVGVHAGHAFAFDAKACATSAFPFKNVHDHQTAYLRSFTKAGGIGALLIGFSDRGSGSFLVSVSWWDDVCDELSHRSSIPFYRFVIGSTDAKERCYALTHGEGGLPIPLHQGFNQLIATR